MNRITQNLANGSGNSPRKPWWRRWFGGRSERAAGRYLKRQGFRVLVRNYICRVGELDLVALDGTVVVFVEVRSTEAGALEKTAASVDAEKQRRLSQTALYFLQQRRLLDRPARFDVLAVSWPADSSEPRILHIRHAFEATGRFQMDS
jgi:putative endonuclease